MCGESGMAWAVALYVYGCLGVLVLFSLADCCSHILFPYFCNLVCGIGMLVELLLLSANSVSDYVVLLAEAWFIIF